MLTLTRCEWNTMSVFALNNQTSPFNEYVDKQIPMLENLVEYYKSVDGRTKNKILGCIFSEKLVFEDGEVATIKFTKPIQLLLNASHMYL